MSSSVLFFVFFCFERMQMRKRDGLPSFFFLDKLLSSDKRKEEGFSSFLSLLVSAQGAAQPRDDTESERERERDIGSASKQWSTRPRERLTYTNKINLSFFFCFCFFERVSFLASHPGLLPPAAPSCCSWLGSALGGSYPRAPRVIAATAAARAASDAVSLM